MGNLYGESEWNNIQIITQSALQPETLLTYFLGCYIPTTFSTISQHDYAYTVCLWNLVSHSRGFALQSLLALHMFIPPQRYATHLHDDVIKWKYFPRCWPFVSGIHRSPVNSPHKRPVTMCFDAFFDLPMNKRLSKLWWGWWFETPSRLLWRQCNGKDMSLNARSTSNIEATETVFMYVWANS